MTAISLPALSRLATVKPRLIRFGADLTPSLGGPVQRLNRLGSRWAVDVAVPSLTYAGARLWLGARLEAERTQNTLIMAWPKTPDPGALGTPLVNGATQAGTSLIVDGLTAGVTIPAFTFFSLSVSGRNYLYAVTTATTANGSGQATLPIAPMLRASPADNAALTFSAPQIEGFFDGATIDWNVDELATVGLSFTLSEIE